ncbi:PA2169 family four-helix-bundle protein [Sphingomonas rosea]|uniref:PA2169 family four-helix-bundle protein n=1 Tax=Sphingomonas rosea TaxID=335605 RepID=A0ABP7TJP5_9SPHN
MIGSNDSNTSGLGTLETLTTTLIDSINGYRDAAEHAEGTRFQEIFRRNADERSRVVEELRAEITRLGGNAPDDGSFLGATHQRFLDLKAAITGRDDTAIVNEVERGEDYLKEKFELALKADIDPQARTVIERAYQSVRQGHDQISALKHGLEA